MNELIKKQLNDAQTLMNKAVDHCDAELLKIRAGKASATMLDGISVDYYGNPTPLQQVCGISTPDARTLVAQPWEKHMIGPIEKAIIDSNVGLNPQNDGIVIRMNVPPLTEERRKDLFKKAKEEAERGRISIRNIRKDINGKIQRSKSEGVSEDEIKDGEAEVQKLTDNYIVKIDKLVELKEKDIMTV
ncbi:MAG: ribosome recycling factor [Pyrinomonadaceae bacterium]|nr:ribosome recycling factor [Sphingobacteriaceae bacterium]